MQATVGLRERVEELGKRGIRNYMPEQHRDFFAMLPTVHLGAVDATGHPWAVTRTGSPGFMISPDPETLEITSNPLPGEPKDLQLGVGDKVSLVGIEYASRRRNRLNATLVERRKEILRLRVDLSFGNCPKYIQTRSAVPSISAPASVRKMTVLDDKHAQFIARADTLFIASRAPEFSEDSSAGVDVNHRGGRPGFVTVINPATIEFPDYAGNNFFQTLGNIHEDGRVGIQLVDFQSGDLMNLKGHAKLIVTGGQDFSMPLTNRRVRIRISEAVFARGAFPLRFAFEDFSPNLPA